MLNVPNILIVDGASHAAHLEGMPLLQVPGPTHQIAYAVHPYCYADDQPNWDIRGGYLAPANALIATEWNYTANSCGSTVQRMARKLLTYLRRTVNIGVSTYQYKVVALDKAGNASVPSSGRTIVFPDTTKPSAPAMLTLTPAKASITLRWAASTDNVAVKAYRVYRGSTLIATVAGPTLSYTNTGLKRGTSYSYHLVAVDAAGNASAAGATMSAKAK